MHPLKCAVIGVGYLGRFHAQKYLQLEHVELVGVCDVAVAEGEAVAAELGVPFYADYRTLLPHVDAVSIVTTTPYHYAIAQACLAQGVHVLIEKPMTETLAEADALIEQARAMQCVLQVGHLERFNAARLALDPYLTDPLFIESQRLAAFKPRGTDVNVILDLMIHDIDLIQSIVKRPIVAIQATGTPVLSAAIDIANARITFDNHCVANVSASRVSFKSERKMRIFQRESYLSIDYQQKQFARFEKGHGELFPGVPNIAQQQFEFEASDALLEEIRAFTQAILTHTKPLVTGQDGREALATALDITAMIHEQLEILHA